MVEAVRAEVTRALECLFDEIAYGAPPAGAYVLNPKDPGLLSTLAGLSAGEASTSHAGGATIAAHVEHLAYGLSLLNRWAAGEDPFTEADWSAAWRRDAVTAQEWTELRRRLREEADRWRQSLAASRRVEGVALNGVIGSIVHLAYHLGAIRQISPAARGPRDGST